MKLSGFFCRYVYYFKTILIQICVVNFFKTLLVLTAFFILDSPLRNYLKADYHIFNVINCKFYYRLFDISHLFKVISKKKCVNS